MVSGFWRDIEIEIERCQDSGERQGQRGVRILERNIDKVVSGFWRETQR